MQVSDDEFTVVIIPDTQGLAELLPDMYVNMSQWIVDHAESLNIKMVMHTGDTIQNVGSETEYRLAQKVMSMIDQAGIPLLLAPGCHDYDKGLSKGDRSSTLFNHYYGLERYKNKPWFGGTYDPETVDNSYAKLEINGSKYIFFALEFGPRNEVLAWVDNILSTHSDHQAIVATHVYMYMYGERTKPGDKHHPDLYSLGPKTGNGNDGEGMWQKIFRKHANMLAVFSGHHINWPKEGPDVNVSYRVDQGDHGNEVFQSYQNWQMAKDEGEGRIRILRINPTTNEFSIHVMNPNTGQYEHDEGFDFTAVLKR